MAEHRWLEAGSKLEEYAQYRPDDWESCYSRGVAFANARRGKQTDVASLRAYNDTIAFAPRIIDDNLRARLFGYRGAILKRLGRLDEAESDLSLASKYATAYYESNDIRYNLAGVFALRGEREKMMKLIRGLRSVPEFLGEVRAHLGDYFARYADDDEFLDAIRGA
jgi:Flp pilus assembly protein TadD